MKISVQIRIRNQVKAALLLAAAGLLMGNQGCQETAGPTDNGERILRRRVQMKRIDAPAIQLPASAGGGQFDFAFVANAQIYDILSKTQSFTTATVDPNDLYDPSQLSDDGKAYFNQCGDEEDAGTPVINKLSGKIQTISRSASCMIDMPQAVIEGSIFDFSLVNSAGLSLGLTGIPVLSGLSFDFQKYELDVELRAKAPLEIGKHYFSTVIDGKFKKDWGASATLNLGQLALGPKFYFSTPLSKVVNEAMTSAVTKLRDNWTLDEPWYTTIIRNCDKYIYINGGYGNDVGLKVGDVVKIANVKYFWEGAACNSYLDSELVAETVGFAKITAVGRNVSEAWIIENDPVNYPRMAAKIYPGSRVYMHQMVKPAVPVAAPASAGTSAPSAASSSSSADSSVGDGFNFVGGN